MTTWQDRMTPQPSREPLLEVVETCWRMRNLQKPDFILECGIYRTDTGLEVRAGYGAEDLLYSLLVPSVRRGHERAAELRQLVIDKGGFEDLPARGDAR
jgi:hypothetical protein